MSWNPVLNKFIEIKNEYKKRIGHITYDYTEGYTNKSETCLERWVSELNSIEPFNQYKEYEDLLSCLELNQHKNMLLIRYARYSSVYDNEVEASGEDFWDRYDGFYRECRSVVIDVEKDCLILAPFRKFFNINELAETALESIEARIKNAKVIEFSNKLDGSMQSARYYNGEIVVAGSQSLNKEISWRLEDGYNRILTQDNYVNMIKSYPNYTFIFEYISLADAHIVKYTKKDEGMYLIGIRNVETGEEKDYSTVLNFAEKYKILTTKIYDKTLDVLMKELDDKQSYEAEGFVINIDNFKVKLKYNDYVFMHRALGKLSSINLIIRSIADDKYDDLISKLPIAYHDRVKKVSSIVFKYINDTNKKINEYYDKAPKENRKDFMIWIDNNVPKNYRSYCKYKYLNKEFNVLKSNDGDPHYKKLKELGVQNYTDIFID